MRVISGKNRGTKLVAPEGNNTRPTTDRIKETLFSVIQFDVPQATFLDVFSGSGAIGIEALSRGAKKCAFIEKDKVALKCINENLEKTKLKQDATIYSEDALMAIEKLERSKETFDIVFLDPPYQLPNIEQIVLAIVQKGVLSAEGMLILEQSTELVIDQIEGLELIKTKKYKTTTLSFFERI